MSKKVETVSNGRQLPTSYSAFDICTENSVPRLIEHDNIKNVHMVADRDSHLELGIFNINAGTGNTSDSAGLSGTDFHEYSKENFLSNSKIMHEMRDFIETRDGLKLLLTKRENINPAKLFKNSNNLGRDINVILTNFIDIDDINVIMSIINKSLR